MLEQAIEVQLKQEYSEDQINAFYTDFSENFENYKSINEDAYEIMTASIDFKKFKDQMLKFKTGVKDEDKSDQKTHNFIAMGVDRYLELAKEDFKDQSLGWSKVCEMSKPDEGYEMLLYKRPIEK